MDDRRRNPSDVPNANPSGDHGDEKYEVDAEAVAGSIIRQLMHEQMWIRYPEVMPLRPREVLVPPEPDDLLSGFDEP